MNSRKISCHKMKRILWCRVSGFSQSKYEGTIEEFPPRASQALNETLSPVVSSLSIVPSALLTWSRFSSAPSYFSSWQFFSQSLFSSTCSDRSLLAFSYSGPGDSLVHYLLCSDLGSSPNPFPHCAFLAAFSFKNLSWALTRVMCLS